ncbi:MAG: TRAP transporter small permease subunit [Rhizobacter sp.]|nr:TRAP transporter small permease subunit [Rhizobacter sp.]
MKALLSWLHRRAENLLVLMITAMFVAFILQIIFRYFLNLPVAWTEEVCVMAWLWGILWGSAFVTRDQDEIRFDMVYSHVSPKTQRVFRAIAGTVFVVVMLLALPATWGYVSFMKVKSSAALLIPLNWVFSVYIVFALAMIVRHAHIVWQALRGTDATGAAA